MRGRLFRRGWKGEELRAFLDFESHKELDEYLTNEPYVIEKMWDKIEIEVIEN